MAEAFGLDVDVDDDDIAHVVDVCGVLKYLDKANGTVTYQLFASENLNSVERLGMLKYAEIFSVQEMEAEWFSFDMGEVDDDD